MPEETVKRRLQDAGDCRSRLGRRPYILHRCEAGRRPQALHSRRNAKRRAKIFGGRLLIAGGFTSRSNSPADVLRAGLFSPYGFRWTLPSRLIAIDSASIGFARLPESRKAEGKISFSQLIADDRSHRVIGRAKIALQIRDSQSKGP